MNLPQGFLSSALASGIKKEGLDLGLVFCPDGAKAAAVFTRNANTSYSVEVCKKNIRNKVQAVIAHSGNANCFTHLNGLKDTFSLCSDCAEILGIDKDNLLIASTGIIGKKMPFNKIKKSVPELTENLTRRFDLFPQAIMTTDTVKKTAFVSFKLGKEKITISGCAKGAGMIDPNMATMLCFLFTDAAISRPFLKKALALAAEKSFNSISVDGCMSTNDSVFLLSSGKGASVKSKNDLDKFSKALERLCVDLAKKIARDGEGASKFLEIDIKAAKTEKEARSAFQAIADSLLFKTAIYGENANWGRIISSLGQAGIKVREDRFKVRASSLKKKEINISVFLGRGKAAWKGWCCDITPEYVKINAGYS